MLEIKTTVAKLYNFISKMMISLEKDINNPDLMEIDESHKIKKNIANMLEKLVSLVLQLNRLSKEEGLDANYSLPENDAKIIERFIRKYEENKAKKVKK